MNKMNKSKVKNYIENHNDPPFKIILFEVVFLNKIILFLYEIILFLS